MEEVDWQFILTLPISHAYLMLDRGDRGLDGECICGDRETIKSVLEAIECP